MDATCRLWVSLGSGRRHRTESSPSTFLRFIHTGLLVGLPDEPGGQLVGDGPLKQFPMRRVDAEGLGLTAEDFTEGVAICREDPQTAGLGWQCERVQLLIGAEERIDALAPRAAPAATAAVQTPAASRPAPPARPRRILAVVDIEAQGDEIVDEAAALAREHGATLLLVATGELPETARHAAEERAALTRRLEDLSAHLEDVSVRSIVEMGGDPVRGILAVADSEAVDLIIAPAWHSRFADAIEPRVAEALGRRSGVPVRSVATPPRTGAARGPARGPADPAQIVVAGLPSGSGGWQAAAETAIAGALAGVAFDRAQIAVQARWYAAPGSTVDHFALAPVIATILRAPVWPAGLTGHVGTLASELIAVSDRQDERLELLVRSA